MSLDAPTQPDPPRLHYSGLPAGSSVVAEPTEQGVTVRVPPRSIFFAMLACAFGALMLLPMTLGIFVLIFRNHSRLYADEIGPVVLMGIVVVTFWPCVIVLAWKS